MILKRIFFFLLVIAAVISACKNKSRNEARACIDYYIYKDGQKVKIDSCFIASTVDSLELKLADVRKRQQEQLESFETRLLVVFVDTLQKEPKDYEYAIALSEAGIINSDVILTKDPSVVTEKCKPYHKNNIIIRKLCVGEHIQGMVEKFFKNNVRINYRRVSNSKIES